MAVAFEELSSEETSPIDPHVSPKEERLMRGWYWYEPEPSPEEKKEEQSAGKKKEERVLPSLKDYPIERLWKMHPDDFQPLLMAFQKKAVQDPTVENVHEYYVVQDVARRKALAFTNVSTFVIQRYPELSVQKDSPIAVPGINARVRQQQGEIEATIRQGQQDYALLYFFSPYCEYCKEQNNILKFFLEKYGWEIRTIDITRDDRASSRFGVRAVPALSLISRKSQEHIPVSVGLSSFSEIEDRLYRGMRLLSGTIRPEEYSLYDFQRGGAFDVLAPLRASEEASRLP
ncbi:MAG: conjugal transfer protein TraF [Candidatus Manganitrophaceae bacterium]